LTEVDQSAPAAAAHAHPAPVAAQGTAARIGPNAITRVAEALEAQGAAVAAVFADAGLGHHLVQPPEHMVDECDVIALQQALRRRLGIAEARCVSFDAGLRTGDYLLAHRIPRPAQRVLRLLPPGAASRLLLKAVGRHAWTFSGSGVFDFSPRSLLRGRPVRVRIAGCPLCRDSQADTPLCDFYTGTFERLFRTLVSARTRVEEIQCQAQGADACIFEMRWR